MSLCAGFFVTPSVVVVVVVVVVGVVVVVVVVVAAVAVAIVLTRAKVQYVCLYPLKRCSERDEK